MSSDSQTNYSLLRRALDLNDTEAWEMLDQYYRRFIYYLLHQLHVNPNEIDDLTQQVMVLLMKKLKLYDSSKGKFRSWLKTIITNMTYSHFRKLKSEKSRIEAFTGEIEGKDDVHHAEIEEIIEKEWEKYISTLAMERVKRTFNEQAIKTFELSLQGHSAAEIAEQVGIQVSSVYTLRKRVKKALYLEVRKLAEQLEG